MVEYKIEYLAQNIYEESVGEAIFEFLVLPAGNATQVVVDHQISNSLNENVFSYKNLFGFEVNRIRTTNDFQELTFQMNATVEKKELELFALPSLPLEEEIAFLKSPLFYIEHHLFLHKTPYTSITESNQKEILKYSMDRPLYEYLIELNNYIYSLLKYEKDITDVNTPADKALILKKGVCQDFVHLFLAMCRYNKIAGRYVSGYLNQTEKFKGSAWMHAWAEAFVPGIGWLGFDPTNNLQADVNYIKVSHGTDYNDCSPIKGVLKTNGDNKTSYAVKVSAGQ